MEIPLPSSDAILTLAPCLSADSLFQSDINEQNPLGMSGQLALAFAVLLRVLWSGQHRSYNPHKLKTLVAKKFTQFTGYAQHDAQEFMAFLLDGLHEVRGRRREGAGWGAG